MIEHQLTQLQYAKPDTIGPWSLYIFGPDGLHSGKQWFAKRIQWPDEEISIDDAEERAGAAISHGYEVRICDIGDMLVFHSQDGKTIYGKDFWKAIRENRQIVQ